MLIGTEGDVRLVSEYMFPPAVHAVCLLPASRAHGNSCKLDAKLCACYYIRLLEKQIWNQSPRYAGVLLPAACCYLRCWHQHVKCCSPVYLFSTVQYFSNMTWLAGSSLISLHPCMLSQQHFRCVIFVEDFCQGAVLVKQVAMRQTLQRADMTFKLSQQASDCWQTIEMTFPTWRQG